MTVRSRTAGLPATCEVAPLTDFYTVFSTPKPVKNPFENKTGTTLYCKMLQVNGAYFHGKYKKKSLLVMSIVQVFAMQEGLSAGGLDKHNW